MLAACTYPAPGARDSQGPRRREPVPQRSDSDIKRDLRTFGMKADAKIIERERREEQKRLVLKLE